MAYRWRKSPEGDWYQRWYYSAADLRQDVKRYVTTPEQARRRIEEIQNLLMKLLDPKLTDAQRASTVMVLKRRLQHGHRQIEDLAAVSKIAVGRGP